MAARLYGRIITYEENMNFGVRWPAGQWNLSPHLGYQFRGIFRYYYSFRKLDFCSGKVRMCQKTKKVGLSQEGHILSRFLAKIPAFFTKAFILYPASLAGLLGNPVKDAKTIAK